ncbi:hypothetical protein M440DRAFT_1395101 [Trichoderma longibrachiatum ATCC 18648]|uniref:Uncharacterized protein n=1 Tax=Trichoderma longibrachiatum ATCC 18648 TaxID=983965 RepID=A0A2T4BS02_TRILO|nr:hypothetical protein M440DRAFT_1395101 [Trichoderma longibrachiatum ATCC 18648]
MEDYRYDHDHDHEYDDDDTMSHADAADTSSHHGHDDDVFSDNNSPRSSMGSVSEGDPRKAAHDGLRSPRISDIQQQYDEPRPSLRSASSSAGKAAQHAAASSPAGQPQPRSGRRSALPTDGDVSFSPTSAVVEILLTPQAKADGENPCAAMEPQTVEKWLTATVTERTTVTRTDMPDADDDLFGSKEGDEEVDDESFEGAKDADGVHYLDGLPGDEEAGEQQQTSGQSDWEWGARFKFPW